MNRKCELYLASCILSMFVAGCAGVAGQSGGGLTITPAAIAFSSVAVNSGASESVSLVNSTSDTVTLTDASSDVTQFPLSGLSLPVTLQPSSTATFQANFSPAAAQAYTGNFSFRYHRGSGSGSTSIPVSGSGVSGSNSPVGSVNPASISYGTVNVGSTSSNSFTVENTGSATMTITSFNSSNAAFQVTGPSMPKSLSNKQSATFNVAFDPTTTGTVSATVSIASNASNTPVQVAVSGIGASTSGTPAPPATSALTPSTNSLTFSSETVGTSATQPVTFTNAGSANVTVSGVTTSGAAFSASGISAGQVIAAGKAATLNVTFDPAASGSASGSVIVASNASNPSITVTLAGSGTAAQPPTNSGSGVPKCGLVADGTNKVPSDWATFAAPAEGGHYVDSTFGCQVTRLTDGVADFGSSPKHSVTVYYSTVDVFSADDAMLWVEVDNGQNYIVQNPYLTGQNGIAVPAASMPGISGSTLMWDRSNPSLFYYANGHSVYSGTVTGRPSCLATHNCTVTSSLVHTFTEYASGAVGMMDETSESVDGCNLLMEGQSASGGTIQVFAWNVCSGTKSNPYTTSCTGTVTGNNNSCIHKMQIAGDNSQLIALDNVNEEIDWNGSTSTCIQGCGSGTGTEHGDAGLDLAGTSVWISGAGGPPYAGNTLANQQNPCPYTAWFSLVKTLTNSPLTAGTCLWDFSPSGLPSGNNGGGWHVGYRGSSQQPWITVSWFNLGCPWYFQADSSYCAPTTSNWPTYGGEIQLLNVGAVQSASTNTNTGVYRLAFDRSRTEENFWAQVLATASYDGKYVAFDSNMAYGVSGCTGTWAAAGDCSDVYIISAPGSFGTSGAPLF